MRTPRRTFVNGGDTLDLTAQDAAPGLRRCPLLRDRYLATVAWLISMPSLSSSPSIRGAPEGIGAAHLTNPVTNLALHSRRPDFKRQLRSAEILDGCHLIGCRLLQQHHVQTTRPESVEPDPNSEQQWRTRRLATKKVQLVTEARFSSSRAARPRNPGKDETMERTC